MNMLGKWITNSEWNNSLFLRLTYDSIANVPVADPASVSQWNTFFGLPTNGTPFTSVVVSGNEVKLFNGANITITDNKFRNDTHLLRIYDTGCIQTLGVDCFRNASIVSVYMKNVTVSSSTRNNYGPFGQSKIKHLSLPKLGDAGGCLCYAALDLESIYLPALHTSTAFEFYYCLKLTRFILPKLRTFNYCSLMYDNILELYAPKVLPENFTTIYNAAFSSASTGPYPSRKIKLTCDPSLLTSNNGGPQWDLLFLLSLNEVTVNGVLYNPYPEKSTGDLELTFDTLTGITQGWGGKLYDPNSVDAWNYAFKHNAWSTPFKSIEWVGNKVILKGGENISLHVDLYDEWQNSHITRIYDHGCVVALNSFAVSPVCLDYTFPAVQFMGEGAIYSNLRTAPLTLPKLKAFEVWAFYENKITEVYLPVVELLGLFSFYGTTTLTKLYAPNVREMGYTNTGSSVWYLVAGNTMELTIPAKFMTINGGNPCGSLAWLIANNTVTLILT
jgi:hypothetical protein